MDVTLNEDKICRNPEHLSDGWVPGSLKRSVVVGTSEPVTLAEVKTNMAISFNQHDDLLEDFIAEARVWCEEVVRQSIVKTSISVTLTVNAFVELPYGPVEIPTDITGIDQQYVSKGDFPAVSGTRGKFDITYIAGYTNPPKWAKKAILARVASMYENRGDQDKENVSQIAKSILAPHKRLSTWL